MSARSIAQNSHGLSLSSLSSLLPLRFFLPSRQQPGNASSALSSRFGFRACAYPGCSFRRSWRFRFRDSGVWLREGSYSAWHCSAECLESALRKRFEDSVESSAPFAVRHRFPLGLMMVARGQLNPGQLQSALESQKIHGGRVGSWLQKFGYISESQLTSMLGLQSACPVLPALTAHAANCAEILPIALLSHFRMLPVWHVPRTGKLVLAFSEGIDYEIFNIVGQMLDCRPEACILAESVMNDALARMGNNQQEDVLFESACSAYEMVRIVSGFVLKLGAQHLVFSRSRDFYWFRLAAGQRSPSILFRRHPARAIS